MMQLISFLLALLIANAAAFAPFGVVSDRSRTICFAKHANDKGAKWAKSKRPKKSSPADINRKPVVYELTSMVKPAEFTISSEPATSVAKSG
ncbi:hypothetical protein FisN_34Hh012 [Fistulifera solaris]|uniref:Uncharacterized protein n=1 Tax=Fistulifera solaris TaxID=1519565 RepID=A0A1Z5KRS4_FISSO|nr:hypothetical protein FisN_34Hh012 [Fistulifera solaris]|eukprot:GAX28802.1 hypothetical protein FisN_34Hh012 [Fistulifera solaris]